MKKYILVVDDDRDDLELLEFARTRIKYQEFEFIYLNDASKLIPHLKEAEHGPLFILSDLNMPGFNGFELRKKMIEDEEVRYKSTPFIFWSTSASPRQIREAYDNLVQGFFVKPSSPNQLAALLEHIITYWSLSQHPKPM